MYMRACVHMCSWCARVCVRLYVCVTVCVCVCVSQCVYAPKAKAFNHMIGLTISIAFRPLLVFITNFQTWNAGRQVITIIHYSYS